MKKAVLLLATFAFCASLPAQDRGPAPRKTRGEAAGYSSRGATVLSMMGWGVLLAVGIGTICALIDNNTGSTTVH